MTLHDRATARGEEMADLMRQGVPKHLPLVQWLAEWLETFALEERVRPIRP